MNEKEVLLNISLYVLRPLNDKLPEEVYDLDAEIESDNEAQTAKVDAGTKEGYLLKGPEIGSERIFSNLASKSFKKRYCSMVRESDGTYILEVYKDDKKTDTKLTIVMDFCSDVVRVSLYFLILFLKLMQHCYGTDTALSTLHPS